MDAPRRLTCPPRLLARARSPGKLVWRGGEGARPLLERMGLLRRVGRLGRRKRGGGNDPEAKRRARTDHVENLTREGVADRSPPTEGKGPGWERELPGKLDSSRGRRGRNRRKERGSDEVGGG